MIPLQIRNKKRDRDAWILLVSSRRPCLSGKPLGVMLGWELGPGVVALGRETDKGLYLPELLRVDDQVHAGTLTGIVLDPFQACADTGEILPDLAAVIRWARKEI